jgi:hypothetical protein
MQIILELQDEKFVKKSKSLNLDRGIWQEKDILNGCMKILNSFELLEPCRMICVKMNNLNISGKFQVSDAKRLEQKHLKHRAIGQRNLNSFMQQGKADSQDNYDHLSCASSMSIDLDQVEVDAIEESEGVLRFDSE